MSYDFEKGKQRVESILTLKTEVDEVKSIPVDQSKWTYDNGIKSWVTAVFVDMRNSKEFFTNTDSVDVARTIRAYTSEIIEIMNQTNLMREIGVRGDCVFGIFSTPSKDSINEVLGLTEWINTFFRMLNELLIDNDLDEIKAGIGMASSQDLIIKAGKKGTGVFDKVWIGSALADADQLSKITSKNDSYINTSNPIAITNIVYHNIKDFANNKELYKKHISGNFYVGNVVKTKMDEWIENGME